MSPETPRRGTSIVGRRPSDTSRRRVKAVSIMPEEVTARTWQSEKIKQTARRTDKTDYATAPPGAVLREHNPVLSDDRPYSTGPSSQQELQPHANSHIT